MTEYKDYENETFTVHDATMRKTNVQGETRFNKYILHLDHDKIEQMSMKLEEYYSEEDQEQIDGVEFNTEEAEAEPVKPDDIPEKVLEIQEKLNDQNLVRLNATITVAKDEDGSNWFINPNNFDDIKVKDE